MLKKLVILGAGESGVGAAILGTKKAWQVFVSDLGKIKNNYKKELEKHSIPFEENRHSKERILQADCVVKSPGISNDTQLIRKIREKGINIISEVEFAYRYTNAKIIAITGSNGKTTTTHLVYNIFKNSNHNTEIAGNMGESFSRKVAYTNPEYFVLEISSFQLEDVVEFSPHIAVLLNITADHLDRYRHKLSLYAKAKFRITENQHASDYLIYNKDDKLIQKLVEEITVKAKLLPFSQKETKLEGAAIVKSKLTIKYKNSFKMNINKLGLKGKHNLYNSMAAAIVANVAEIDDPIIRDALSDFKGIKHRLEEVLTIRDVAYINDSKATNINAVWYALEYIKTPIVWIAGGTDKDNDYNLLKDLVREKVKAIICLTKDSQKIHETFDECINPVVDTLSMKEAVNFAYKFSDKGDTVLLSPACASFDLFNNYEDRGNQFKKAVRNL